MSTVLKLGIVVFAVVVLMTPSVAFAAEGESSPLISLGGAFGAGLVILGAGMGIGKIGAAAVEYGRKMESGKKWAGCSIPVVYDKETEQLYRFDTNPMWVAIYYPHFKKMIDGLK